MNSLHKGIVAVVVILWSVGLGLNGLCAEYKQGVKVNVIKKTTTAANGQELAYPRDAKPEVTVATVEIPPGAETGWHAHPFPVYAYVMAGTLAVAVEGAGEHLFKEGEAIIEVMDTQHNGRNRGSVPVRLVVFYTGVQGGQNTVTAPK